MSSCGEPSVNLESSDLQIPFAIIGGSGMCTFPEAREVGRVNPDTPYGKPSDELVIVEFEGTPFVFLPRHGSTHSLPPHKIPYQANMAALRSLGVKHVIGLSIGGSLRKDIEPGHIVVPDQFVNLTWGRDDLVRADGSFLHLPMADPYCGSMRSELSSAIKRAGGSVHSEGTVVVIQGPRFSTRAESQWFMRNGWDAVNMTQYPECYLAREFGLCYAAAIAITDYDVGIPGLNLDARNIEQVLAVFRRNVIVLKQAAKLTALLSGGFHCSCATDIHLPFYKK